MTARALWEVSAPAILKNVESIAAFSKKGIIAVVKANAYGHGATLVAPLLDQSPFVKMFAVSCSSEGVELRRAGVKKPILLLSGFFKEELPEIEKFRLTPVVSTRGQLLEVIRRKIPYHLNIDTGMGRLGFLKPPLGILKFFPPRGVMTHFPSADEDPSFTKKQIRRFFRLIKPLKGVRWVHLQNSAGLFYDVPEANLVRVGLAVYGELPRRGGGLKLSFPSRISARIVSVRRLPAGSCISYGCRKRLRKTSWVGIISFGYADGLPRRVFKTLKVRYKGKTFPVAGDITMDLTAVEFGNVKPKEGDWAVLIDESFRFSDLASLAGTIPYEIMTSVGRRVQRRLVENL